MKNRGSKITNSIDKDYRRQKQWKDKVERMKELKENKVDILILAEHSREPLIIEKEDK